MPAPPPAFFAHGHAVDLILAVIAAEFALLSARRKPGEMLNRLLAFAPGVCLLLALRAAMTGANWIWVAAFLAASFPVHLGDLIRRRL